MSDRPRGNDEMPIFERGGVSSRESPMPSYCPKSHVLNQTVYCGSMVQLQFILGDIFDIVSSGLG